MSRRRLNEYRHPDKLRRFRSIANGFGINKVEVIHTNNASILV
ncbi:hypothetical protein F383_20898 [Gossypium arboreum]|uniref:Uncharacterized protein n=1 Tax=Gossypium arboreum TaxID=29729 RepID=A0A0B0NWD9_GOSAR|nr:hypothetical protein F383_20898 [Gossypium arboreum]